MSTVPRHAQVVVIGGGIAGCSAAYHLTLNGCKDVILLERKQITSGSTWHAAGMVGQLRTNANVTRLLQHSVALYERLEEETGLSTGWMRQGSLRLSCSDDRTAEIERQVTMARSFGFDVELLAPNEIAQLCPGMSVDGVKCGVFVPSDGVANPSDLTASLAKGARNRGCRVYEGATVTGFQIANGRVCGVETDQGVIKCQAVVLCAGLWSREIARLAGVCVPLQASHHQYMVTESIAGLDRNMPSVRDPDNLTYFKPEVGGLVAGGYEFNPIPASKIPSFDDAEFKLYPEFMEHFEQFMPAMVERFPALETTGVKQWFNGLESFTEDTHFILGQAPELTGFFVACGFNAMGIAAGGGAGMAIAHWVLEGEPPFDLWPVDIRRFSSFHRSDRNVQLRSLEGQGHHYAYHWPYYEFHANRPLRRSAIFERLSANGACFGAKSGWERPNWFATGDEVPKDEYSFGRGNWFKYVGSEHQACRKNVALFDQSSFAKALVIGRDAAKMLQRVCAADVGKPPGRLSYTQALNSKGGIECDFTAARLAEDIYYVVTGTAMATHDFGHLKRNVAEGENVSVVDITSQYGVLGLMGPRSRGVLTEIAECDLNNEAFPFGHVREVMIAGAPVRALRVSFVGELGWELHVPSEYLATVYDALVCAGRKHELRNAGYRAIDSLRLEKKFVVWGAEVGPDYSPIEAGLSGVIAFNKKEEFIGREALMRNVENAPTRRLVGFSVEDKSACLFGRETIYRNDVVVGWLSSGGYGYTVDKPIGLGYVSHLDGVTDDFLLSGEYEIEVASRRLPAEIHLKAMYDPGGARVRG